MLINEEGHGARSDVQAMWSIVPDQTVTWLSCSLKKAVQCRPIAVLSVSGRRAWITSSRLQAEVGGMRKGHGMRVVDGMRNKRHNLCRSSADLHLQLAPTRPFRSLEMRKQTTDWGTDHVTCRRTSDRCGLRCVDRSVGRSVGQPIGLVPAGHRHQSHPVAHPVALFTCTGKCKPNSSEHASANDTVIADRESSTFGKRGQSAARMPTSHVIRDVGLRSLSYSFVQLLTDDNADYKRWETRAPSMT